MEIVTTNMDLKIILNLIIDGHLDPKVGLKLLANAHEVDADKLEFAIYKIQRRQSRHWTKEEDEDLIAGWNNGERTVNIATKLKRNPATIYMRIKHLEKLGRPVTGRRKSEDYKKRS